jgi:hypothetical protein
VRLVQGHMGLVLANYAAGSAGSSCPSFQVDTGNEMIVTVERNVSHENAEDVLEAGQLCLRFPACACTAQAGAAITY